MKIKTNYNYEPIGKKNKITSKWGFETKQLHIGQEEADLAKALRVCLRDTSAKKYIKE